MTIYLLVWITAFLMLALVVAPILSFLFMPQGWKARRQEILDSLNDEAAEAYFVTFHPELSDDGKPARQRLEEYYDDQFGRRSFVVPFVLFLAIVSAMLVWIRLTVLKYMGLEPPAVGGLSPVVMSALMGAYTWVAYDQIVRWSDGSLSPVGLFWASFRLAIATPLGVAFAASVKDEVGLPLVFLLGAFPTNTLMTVARRMALRQMTWGEENIVTGQESELQVIQGIDTRKAEAFTAEGITTVLQLAYADPIKLTIRTNLGFSFVNDLAGQALLWIYVESELPKFRRFALRGSYEVVSLWNALQSEDEAEVKQAKAVVERLASDLPMPLEGLRNILSEVAGDPYALFLYHSWSTPEEEDRES